MSRCILHAQNSCQAQPQQHSCISGGMHCTDVRLSHSSLASALYKPPAGCVCLGVFNQAAASAELVIELQLLVIIYGEAQCIFVCRYTDAAALRDNLRQIEQQANLAQAQADGLKELRQSSKNFQLGKRVANKKANWKGVVVG